MRKPFFVFIAAASLAGIGTGTWAQAYPQPAPISPRAQYDLDRNAALARYKQDQKLCDDGLDSASRMQCKRDAKAEYDNAIAAAKVHLTAATHPAPAPTPAYAPPPPPAPAAQAYPPPVQPVLAPPAPVQALPAPPACYDCGQVTNVYPVEKKGQGSGLGVIAGAVAGGVLGHQVGGGVGKSLATVAGAAGGAFAGNAIEKNAKSQKAWVVSVTYPNGAVTDYEFTSAPVFKVGDTVRNAGQSIAYP